MSNLTFLVAESFLVIVGAFTTMLFGRFARDVGDQVVTGVVRGTPISPNVREGMLFNLWLPWQAATVALTAFLALAQIEMANHVSGASVRLVVYLAAFLAACASGFALMSASFAFAGYRAKLRRDKQRQGEAD